MACAGQDLVIFTSFKFFQTLRLLLAPQEAARPRGQPGPRPGGPQAGAGGALAQRKKAEAAFSLAEKQL